MAGWQPLPRSDIFFAFLTTKISQNIQHVTLLFTLITKSSVLLVNLCRCLFLPVACCLRAILQESEAKLEMKIFNPPLFFSVWR